MLTVEIKKRFGSFRLDTRFEAGNETLAILGASGSGKSVTLQCVAGVVTPDEGRIALDGRVLYDSEKKINLPPQRRHVGYLFQNYALFPHMTVEENVASGIRGVPKAERDARVREKIRSFYLNGMEGKYPRQLSGGQQQRVALARILASEPLLLMLDEPFSALDSYLRWQLEQELSATLCAFPGTALFVSHNRDEVYRLCGSVLTMDRGRSESVTPVRALFEHPGTLSAALLSGCKNYSRIQKTGPHGALALDWGAALVTAEDPADAAYAGIRAHYVSLENNGAPNAVPCRILHIVEDVFQTIVTLKPLAAAGDADFSRLRAELPKEKTAGLREGDGVTAYIRPGDLMLLK